MNREINLVGFTKKSKKRARFGKKNRSPINLGMVVISPKKIEKKNKNQNRYKLKIKSNIKKDKMSLAKKIPVQNLKIRSPLKKNQSKAKQDPIEKYVKVTKKLVPKTYNRFNNKTNKNIYKKRDVKQCSNFRKIKFNFCKTLYQKSDIPIFDLSVLDKVKNNLPNYKNLPIEDKYICSILSNNIIFQQNTH